jgi:collagenase-like PrtC family protease
MNTEVSFSVATNFRDDLLDALKGRPVSEVFGKLPSDSVGGGRASFTLGPLSVGAFKRHVARARQMGIGFNYLINAACLDNREYTRGGQRDLRRLLEFIEGCGVEGVTISLPFLLPIIKKNHPRLKVRVGVYARVDGVAKARFWEDMGADCITLESISVNRDFETLEGIRKAVGIRLQLIANSNCLMFCPLSGQHMVNLSHASQGGHKSRGFMIDYCVLKCSREKLNDPANYLRSEFIRPEDLYTYVDMGYTSFKILERGAPTALMAKRVAAYTERRFDGNLLDLIQPYGYKERTGINNGRLGPLGNFLRYFFRPGSVKVSKLLRLKKLAAKRGMLEPLTGDPIYIDNRALDGFLDGFRRRDCRNTDCAACGYCESFAKKAVRVDEGYKAELMKLYEECFNDMHSGATWGIGG